MLKGLLRAFVDVPIENDACFVTGFDLLALINIATTLVLWESLKTPFV